MNLSGNFKLLQRTCHHLKILKYPPRRLIHHNVYVSQSNNIFQNLALEDWIYENIKFQEENLLILWRNKPTVVIGRHQNPWTECNIDLLQRNDVDLARRRSGGGTVYHDLGNLNCTFFTTKERYNRKENLEFIVRALNEKWDLNLAVTERDDIMLDGCHKISGTAAKLGGKVAYHHCTVLLDVDTDQLNSLLHSPTVGLVSKATESVRADVKNLRDLAPTMNYEDLVNTISGKYLQTAKQNGFTAGEVQLVDPHLEKDFPGIRKMTEALEQWDWIYGKTPKFTVLRSFSKRYENTNINSDISLEINKGRITNIEVELNSALDIGEQDILARMKARLVGKRFWFEEIDPVLLEYQNDTYSTSTIKWICSCILATLA